MRAGNRPEVTLVANATELASSILDEISFASAEILDTDLLLRKWKNRLALQFPVHFLDADAYRRLEQSLEAALSLFGRGDRRSDAELQGLILSAVFSDEPWRISYYDGNAAPGANLHFDEPLKIEEPPFVVPTLRRRPFALADARDSVLLFKSPADAYRIGMYERLWGIRWQDDRWIPVSFVTFEVGLRLQHRKRVQVFMSTAINTASSFPHSLAGRIKATVGAEESRVSKGLAEATSSAVGASDAGVTVSLSSAALGLLEGIGESAIDVVKGAGELVADVVEGPLSIAGDVASGLVNAVEDVAKAGWDVIAGGMGSFGSDAGAAVKSVLVDAPTTVAKDVESDAKSVVDDAATLGTGVLGLSTAGVA